MFYVFCFTPYNAHKIHTKYKLISLSLIFKTSGFQIKHSKIIN